MFQVLLVAASAAVGYKYLTRKRTEVVPLVTQPELITWFADHIHVREDDPQVVGFTLLWRPVRLGQPPEVKGIVAERRPQAPVVLIQGFFNRATEQVVETRMIEALAMDDETQLAHAENTIVLFS